MRGRVKYMGGHSEQGWGQCGWRRGAWGTGLCCSGLGGSQAKRKSQQPSGTPPLCRYGGAQEEPALSFLSALLGSPPFPSAEFPHSLSQLF